MSENNLLGDDLRARRELIQPDSASMLHPHVGELMVSRERLAIGGAAGQTLVVYHAQSGTSSGKKLTVLASRTSRTTTVARDAI